MKGMRTLVACSGLGFILLKTLPKAISMYMGLEAALDVRFTKTDRVTFATGERFLLLVLGIIR